MNRKCGILCTGMGLGGASIDTLRIADMLRKRGWSLSFAGGFFEDLLEIGTKGSVYVFPDLDRYNDKWLELRELIYREGLSDLEKIRLEKAFEGEVRKLKAQLIDWIRTEQLDMVIGVQLFIRVNDIATASFLAAIEETRTPTIFRDHDLCMEQRYLAERANLKLPEPYSYPFAVYTPTSQFGASVLTRISARIRPIVIHPFVEMPQVDMKLLARGFRRSHDIPDNAFVVLQPTRLSPVKRVDRAVAFIPKLRHAFEKRGYKKDIRLVIASQIPNPTIFPRVFRELRQLVEKLGLGGEVLCLDGAASLSWSNTAPYKTIEAAYAAADLVTYLSEYETWGLVPLEAAVYKRACFVNRYHRLIVIPYLEAHFLQGSKDYCTYDEIYKSKGFQFFEMDSTQVDCPTEGHAQEIVEVFLDPSVLSTMLNTNYELAIQHYSKQKATKMWHAILRHFQI